MPFSEFGYIFECFVANACCGCWSVVFCFSAVSFLKISVIWTIFPSIGRHLDISDWFKMNVGIGLIFCKEYIIPSPVFYLALLLFMD